jgi:hypothetical protein
MQILDIVEHFLTELQILIKAVFPLAKVNAIMPATATVITYLPWPPWAM